MKKRREKTPPLHALSLSEMYQLVGYLIWGSSHVIYCLAFHHQVESVDGCSKGTATICCGYMEEVPDHEISFECLHGPRQNCKHLLKQFLPVIDSDSGPSHLMTMTMAMC